MWSRSQSRASTVQRGKTQWPSRRIDELAHPCGWVVGVDGVAAGHVQDRLDDDLGVADPVAELGHGGGAELLDGAGGEGGAAVGVDVEVLGVDVDVELDLAACLAPRRSQVEGGLAGDRAVIRPMALILRTPRGSVSPSRKSWWAMAQTRS